MTDTPEPFVSPCRSQLRRDFLKQAGALALATPAVMALELPPCLAAGKKAKPPETLVSVLYDSLNEKQKNEVCFDWDHVDKTRGLLRFNVKS